MGTHCAPFLLIIEKRAENGSPRGLLLDKKNNGRQKIVHLLSGFTIQLGLHPQIHEKCCKANPMQYHGKPSDALK
jgi:hypothetical protein